ncbi:AbrB family transcriptional regulator [Pseudohoeflea coraliihabitans]|uniref:AbrB family transcriptional regulator n=1 Tax=Pseudohoeflea coraliihabitans TaxID=2860393 RepID=A0ABS6WM79_9HYPH|nr:AbrB family transcriptional regulator [Pseudohoeflea sp. DP4N28-3]MBW3096179.1 AbrB family transcriptional regulator [Pseudohoeflea sp. DP4N28-3]
MSSSFRSHLAALIIGAMGGGLAFLLGAPAPFLIGPAIAAAVAALAGVRVAVGRWTRDLTFIVLGVTMGQSVTPDVLSAATRWPVTLVLLAVLLVTILLVTRIMLERFWHMDRTTALLSASPGHLGYVLGLSEGMQADLAAVSIIQSFRVLSLTIAVPVAALVIAPLPSAAEMAAPAPLAPLQFVLVLAAAGLAGWGLHRVRLPAAYLMGGLGVSLLLHGSTMVTGNMPPAVTTVAFIVLGTLIGSRFSGVSFAELRRCIGAGIAVTLVSVMLAFVFALAASAASGLPLTAVLIAFAPGGVETMSAMSVLLGVDPTFVAAHHISRLLMLTFIVPALVLRRPAA